MSPWVQNKFLNILIIISGPCSLREVGPVLVILFSTNITASKTRWEVSNKVDNLVIGIFDYSLSIYLCINTGISFVLRDIALFLGGLMEVGATIEMRVAGGVGVLCMRKLYLTSLCPHYGFNSIAHPVILLL